jgi:bifunctional DNase/RNase
MSGERIVLRHMAVWALAVDSLTKSPIVILKEVGGEKTLPIWIGILEAISIASELQGVKFLRPTTHDLLKNILELIDAKVNNVEICDLKNNT